jgi:hypothetical protein
MSREEMFLDVVNTMQQLVWIEGILRECRNRAVAMRIMRMITPSLLRHHEELPALHKQSQWHEKCLQIITDNINAWCSAMPELAPAIWGLDRATVDHVINIFYSCYLTSANSGVIGTATAVIAEEMRHVLTNTFGCSTDDAWWVGNNVITLSTSQDAIAITLCDENEKEARWERRTPCTAATLRRWITDVTTEITRRVSGHHTTQQYDVTAVEQST